MGQMATSIKRHPQNGIARLAQCQHNCTVRLRTGMWLNVDKLTAKQFFGAINRKLLGNINKFAPAVITTRRITFGIFVRQNRSLSFDHGFGNNVFRSNHLNLVLLTILFIGDGFEQCRIGVGQAGREKAFERHAGASLNAI